MVGEGVVTYPTDLRGLKSHTNPTSHWAPRSPGAVGTLETEGIPRPQGRLGRLGTTERNRALETLEIRTLPI